jgi:hypothetical protein
MIVALTASRVMDSQYDHGGHDALPEDGHVCPAPLPDRCTSRCSVLWCWLVTVS